MDNRGETPDEFDLTSTDGQLTIRFSDFGTVRPQLNYHDQREPEPRFFGPQDIRRSGDSTLGELITVTLQVIIDGDQLDFTVLLPPVRLREDADQEDVATIAIRTTIRGSIAPLLLTGQLHLYEVVQLRGQARRVVMTDASAASPA